LLVNYGCPGGSTPDTCQKSENTDWRYLYITLGGLCFVMAMIRAFILRSRLLRWLIACGRISEAVDVLNNISDVNRAEHTASVESFIPDTRQRTQTKSLKKNVRRAARLFSGPGHLRLMTCILGLWGLIRISYATPFPSKYAPADFRLRYPLYAIFLPYYLAANGAKLGESSNYIN